MEKEYWYLQMFLISWNGSFLERLVLADDIPPMKIAAKVFILPRATHEDYYALKIMSEMLSGSATDLFREDLVTQRSKLWKPLVHILMTSLVVECLFLHLLTYHSKVKTIVSTNTGQFRQFG